MSTLENLSLKDVVSFGEKIKSFMPEIIEYLPKLHEMEKEMASKKGLKPGEKIYYTLTFLPDRIWFYTFVGRIVKEDIFTKEFTIKKGSLLIDRHLDKLEILQYAHKMQKQGVMGLINEIGIEKFLKP